MCDIATAVCTRLHPASAALYMARVAATMFDALRLDISGMTPNDYAESLTSYARENFRVACLAMCRFAEEEYGVMFQHCARAPRASLVMAASLLNRDALSSHFVRLQASTFETMRAEAAEFGLVPTDPANIFVACNEPLACDLFADRAAFAARLLFVLMRDVFTAGVNRALGGRGRAMVVSLMVELLAGPASEAGRSAITDTLTSPPQPPPQVSRPDTNELIRFASSVNRALRKVASFARLDGYDYG